MEHETDIVTANDMVWDRQIFDRDGREVGKVDDIELDVPADGGPPVVTALLCGPTALGPRIGDRIGTWWSAVGRRMSPGDDPYPARIPIEKVAKFDRRRVRLRVAAPELPVDHMREWTRRHIIERIPGGRR
ncbi:hypothetical protein FNH05_19955 [Amycolatopsis rhizosphaerae]|uniref:PRC-barrel domain containing protein n=1 Tax=Amycolatopsis rhizosphaerae TaxID=2053003 RepID=A0A558CCA6_9PSEU|nr:hypothetical protein [Amycolatopsis rhizosphaerae]TVT46408.1 hypothetical protein FNH05_19955 [Amycolatopsis rhizosphaerae]